VRANGRKRSSLHSAVGQKDIVKSLLANNADLNAKDNKGNTPLDVASLLRHSGTPKWPGHSRRRRKQFAPGTRRGGSGAVDSFLPRDS